MNKIIESTFKRLVDFTSFGRTFYKLFVAAALFTGFDLGSDSPVLFVGPQTQCTIESISTLCRQLREAKTPHGVLTTQQAEKDRSLSVCVSLSLSRSHACTPHARKNTQQDRQRAISVTHSQIVRHVRRCYRTPGLGAIGGGAHTERFVHTRTCVQLKVRFIYKTEKRNWLFVFAQQHSKETEADSARERCSRRLDW